MVVCLTKLGADGLLIRQPSTPTIARVGRAAADEGHEPTHRPTTYNRGPRAGGRALFRDVLDECLDPGRARQGLKGRIGGPRPRDTRMLHDRQP